MREQGIWAPPGRRSASPPSPIPTHVRAPDLVNRNFTATRPDALWVADFTYCSTWSGVVYVAFIIDVFSRRLVGWKAARSMTTALVLDALNMAAWTRRNTSLDGLICHTDAGSQYTSVLYTDRHRRGGRRPSIGTVGDSLRQRHGRIGHGHLQDRLHRNPPPWPPTAVPGEVSTTSRSPPARGCPGSTRSGCTPNSTTGRRPRSKPTTVTSLSPMRHEKTKRTSARQTQAGSLRLCLTTKHR